MTDSTPKLTILLALVLAGASSLATASEASREATPEAGPIERQAITGQVRLVDEDGQAVRDAGEFANAVVYFEPDDPELHQPVEAATALTTRSRQFQPRVLAIQVGTEVTFPNEDRILHNVFSNSSGNAFDLGLYGESPGESHRFDEPGLVRIFCNVHSRMSAHIVVVDSPHYAHPARDGRCRLEDIEPAPGQLTVWHERSEPVRMRIDELDSLHELGEIELALTVREARPERERRRGRRRY